jgi:serpin B
MKRFIIILTSLLILFLPGCQKEETKPVLEPKQIELPSKGEDVVSKSNEFGVELFRLAALDEPEKNLMLSPLSASVALTMLLNGCAGNTYDQIHDMLGYEGLTIEEINETYEILASQLPSVDPEVELALGNAVWYDHLFPVKSTFLAMMDNHYQAHIEALDFRTLEALDVINQWASDNTNGKIPEVLDEISAEAVMFLMNALYFKGSWTWKFDKTNTSEKLFTTDNGSQVLVDMMSGEIPVRTVNHTDFTAVEMYYGRQNFSMVFMLPNTTVAELLQAYTADDWKQMTANLDAISDPTQVIITLPKFSFDYEKKLNDELKQLGMTEAFKLGLANLSNISDAGIFVSFVKQDSFIQLDEEGTEAAAVTTVGIEYTAIPEQVVINKPFLFAIRERTTNTLMFIGKVMDPAMN